MPRVLATNVLRFSLPVCCAGYANDPYDGDWALGPLGGKGVKTQVSFPAVRLTIGQHLLRRV